MAGWPLPLPIIIISAYPDRAREAAIEAGAVCFLDKPVDSDELLSCLEQVLGPLDRNDHTKV